MITREQAIDALYEVVNSGILYDELEKRLTEAATAIVYENYGIHLWGTKEDDIEDFDPYVFAPSDFEEAEVKANIDRAMQETTPQEAVRTSQSDETTENDK